MNNSTDCSAVVASNVTQGSECVHQFTRYSYFELLHIAAPHLVIIDRVISPIWYLLGLVGNPVSAMIWLSRKVCKNNSSAVYFGSLAIVQFVYLILHIVYDLQMAWDVTTYNTAGSSCELFNFLFITPQYLVPMLVLGFTTERYIAVCHPFVKEKYCTVTRAKIVICSMAVFAVALGLVQIYIWSYYDGMGCVFREGTEKFNKAWTWATEILLFLVIPVTCLVINILVIVEIRRLSVQSAARGQGQTSGNAASTTTLLCVSFYFILTLLPATIVYSIQASVQQGDPYLPVAMWSQDPVWSQYLSYLTMRKIVEEICLSNYATYVIIYYTTGAYFRREVNNRLLCGRWRQIKGRRGNRAVTSDYSMSMTNGRATCTETMALDPIDSPSE